MAIAVTMAPITMPGRRNLLGSADFRCWVSTRSLAAVVVRSRMMANSTIARPALNAVPTSWVDNAWITTWPRPGAAISAAIVTIASAAMMVWLMPSTMVRLAIG